MPEPAEKPSLHMCTGLAAVQPNAPHLHQPSFAFFLPCLGHVFDLLAQCPEQEQSLLSMLVNKIGDPDGKVASRTSLFLLKLGEW